MSLSQISIPSLQSSLNSLPLSYPKPKHTHGGRFGGCSSGGRSSGSKSSGLSGSVKVGFFTWVFCWVWDGFSGGFELMWVWTVFELGFRWVWIDFELGFPVGLAWFWVGFSNCLCWFWFNFPLILGWFCGGANGLCWWWLGGARLWWWWVGGWVVLLLLFFFSFFLCSAAAVLLWMLGKRSQVLLYSAIVNIHIFTPTDVGSSEEKLCKFCHFLYFRCTGTQFCKCETY